MNSERRTILSLVATGRITARQAERLLAVCPDEDDFILRVAVCSAVLWTLLPHFRELLDGCARCLGSLFPSAAITAHHALACLAPFFGGLL
jgi:hypothetical protein